MGIDKLAKVLQPDWPVRTTTIIPGTAQTAMYIIGGVEIAAAIIVLVIPRFGGLLVAGRLGGIVASLIIVGSYGDTVLHDSPAPGARRGHGAGQRVALVLR